MTMLITAPPIVANFFQGTMSQFMWSNAFAGGGAGGADRNGRQPGQAGYMPQQTGKDAGSANDPLSQQSSKIINGSVGGASTALEKDTGKYGNLPDNLKNSTGGVDVKG